MPVCVSTCHTSTITTKSGDTWMPGQPLAWQVGTCRSAERRCSSGLKKTSRRTDNFSVRLLAFLLLLDNYWQALPKKWQALPKNWQGLPVFTQRGMIFSVRLGERTGWALMVSGWHADVCSDVLCSWDRDIKQEEGVQGECTSSSCYVG